MIKIALLIALIIILISGTVCAKVIGGGVSGPAPCTITENQSTNYFPLGNSGTRALFTDSVSGDIYFSILVNNGNPSVIKCSSLCGGWFGLQGVLYTGRPTVIAVNPNSFAEDINQPTHFFEIWVGGATVSIFRTAKNGSARTSIYSVALGINGNEIVAFDPFSDRVMFNKGDISRVYRMDRAGANIQIWNPVGGYFIATIGAFSDGRIILWDCTNRRLRLFTAWSGAQTQFFNLPIQYAGCDFRWISVDNVRNQVHIFAEPTDHGVWDIPSNTFLTRVWVGGVGARFQGAYFRNWVYVKSSASDILRYNWTTGVEQSWNGVQWIH